MNNQRITMKNQNSYTEPLRILISSRVRLTPEQRRTLKANYRALRDRELPAAAPTVGGSGITVTTSFGGRTSVDNQLGLNSILISDILSSSESLQLPTILRLQTVLEVELITEKEFLDACKGYWKHLAQQAGAFK